MTDHPATIAFPRIGFPVTICVICYGDHELLARQFLGSLYNRTPQSLFNLRIGLNEAGSATRKIVGEFCDTHSNIRTIEESINTFKNPLMRRLFSEPPLDSDWTLWFDDDSYVTRSDWLQRLAQRIEAYPEVDQWGVVCKADVRDPEFPSFTESASWYRGSKLKPSTEFPDAVEVKFCTGGFWAIRTRVLHDLDWPDPRLVQAREDTLLGEAMRQNGFRIGAFNYGIEVNTAERRNADAEPIKRIEFGH